MPLDPPIAPAVAGDAAASSEVAPATLEAATPVRPSADAVVAPLPATPAQTGAEPPSPAPAPARASTEASAGAPPAGAGTREDSSPGPTDPVSAQPAAPQEAPVSLQSADAASLRDPSSATTATTQQTAQPLPDAAPSSAGAVGSAVLALLLVVALILALAWLARRMPGAVASSNKSLRVVASLAVGQRERVMVVDVGGTQLLLGVGPGGTRTLHTLAEPLPAHDAPAPFAQLLAQQFGKKS
ncbi:MAG: flagellar biosynthetic protein FliO [Proteobacteria bacterium]|nr:flagellar biosynthetic protein FliO [Pseudomonadota bacterium]